MLRELLLIMVGATMLCAQPFALPKALEDELTKKAEEVTEVTLDATMLGFAKMAISGKDADQAVARRVIDRLKGVYVRVYEFADANAYTSAQLEPLRAQLSQSTWKKLVNVRSKKGGDNVEVFIRMENGMNTGLTVIAGERKELAIIHIDGPIDLSDLSGLAGNFGIPNLEGIGKETVAPKSSGVKEEEE